MTSTLAHSSLPLLSELMRRDGITTHWIAETTGLSACAVRSLLRAERTSSEFKSTRPETVEIIAELFDLRVDEIRWCLPIEMVGKASGTSDGAHKSASHRSPVCAKCSVELPLTGICDNCD